MDIAILFSLGALACGAGGLLLALRIYSKPPGWLKGLLGEFGDFNAEDLGDALAQMVKGIYSDAVVIDPETNVERPMSTGEAATTALQVVAASTVAVAMPMLLEELPVIMATMGGTKVAKTMQKRSAWARGVAKLDKKGIVGIQGFKETLNSVGEAFGKGAIGDNNPLLKKIMALKQGADFLGIDVQEVVEKMTSGDNSHSTDTPCGEPAAPTGGAGDYPWSPPC